MVSLSPSTIVSKMADLKLHGTYPSPMSYRVIWGLKLKGIPYEYVEEDLSNKSPLLLQYNPVHKKIPVLVHGGKPICESMVILEYIDETWPEKPLLPTDPFKRATARFWIKFIEDKGPTIWGVFLTKGEEESEKARKESLEVLRTIEDQALADGNKFFGGDEINAVDFAFGWIARWLPVYEEVATVKLLETEPFPRLKDWMKNFLEAPVIGDNIPGHDELAVYVKRRYEQMMKSQESETK